jgi:Flp pilus assembly protein CpaB
MQSPPPDTRGLQRRLPDRVMVALGRHRMGGRRARTARRVAALLLLASAGVLAAAQPSPAGSGVPVLAAARDLPAGATLAPGDLATTALAAPPNGALAAGSAAAGRGLSGPVRRGEVLTDVRLLGADGPQPGPGRVAVPIRPDDPGMVDLLSPGMRVAIIGVGSDGAAQTLTDDAVVLWIPASDAGAAPAGRGRLVVLAVPTAVADRVAAVAITGSVGLRFA